MQITKIISCFAGVAGLGLIGYSFYMTDSKKSRNVLIAGGVLLGASAMHLYGRYKHDQGLESGKLIQTLEQGALKTMPK